MTHLPDEAAGAASLSARLAEERSRLIQSMEQLQDLCRSSGAERSPHFDAYAKAVERLGRIERQRRSETLARQLSANARASRPGQSDD